MLRCALPAIDAQPRRASDAPNLARHDLPQLVLTTYFLKQSFGDCLVADKSDYTAIMSVVQSCQLTDGAAFMVILSLVTSACYFGCERLSGSHFVLPLSRVLAVLATRPSDDLFRRR